VATASSPTGSTLAATTPLEQHIKEFFPHVSHIVNVFESISLTPHSPKIGGISAIHIAPRAPKLLKLKGGESYYGVDYNCSMVSKLIKTLCQLNAELDEAEKHLKHEKLYLSVKGRRPTMRVSWWKLWQDKVDAISYYETETERLKRELDKSKTEMMVESPL